jgi:hypothetical protein
LLLHTGCVCGQRLHAVLSLPCACILSLPPFIKWLSHCLQVEAALGRLRCLAALAEWDRLSSLARQEWHRVDPQVCIEAEHRTEAAAMSRTLQALTRFTTSLECA